MRLLFSLMLMGRQPGLRGRKSAAAILLALVTVGCASTRAPEPAPEVAPPVPAVVEQPRVEPPPPRKPVVGLVLGGGATRGFAHVGVIKALHAQGVIPDLVVGSSAGSVVGAVYAATQDPKSLEVRALDIDAKQVFDYSLQRMGLVKGERIENFINGALGQRPFESLKIPFAVVATDLKSGQLVIFNRGNVGKAVRASSSIPGMFHPVTIDGREYSDGSLVSPVPVGVARQMGADVVIAVDVWYRPSESKLRNIFDVMFQAFHIMAQTLSACQLRSADVVIQPQFGPQDTVTFTNKQELIRLGEEAVTRALPKVRAALEVASKAPLAARGARADNGFVCL